MREDLPAPGGPVTPITTDSVFMLARPARISASALGSRSTWLRGGPGWSDLHLEQTRVTSASLPRSSFLLFVGKTHGGVYDIR
ncbi:MAG: hypothetical protein CM15mP125_4210 [Gammaproteobacteria bacterium]|nr:MAG: hypothetical protein CM15mP125_4210 [Gammaproteobacteria bacterium]